LYQTALNDAKFSKKISDRQFNLVQTLMIITVSQNNQFFAQADLYRMPQIQVLYSGKVERTFYRDIAKLIEHSFLTEQDGLIVLGN
jgi:hypothetical protein